MTMTVVGKPQKFRPVYNPIVFYINSTNVAQENFKYYVQLFYSGTSNLICPALELFARPIDNYGVVDVNQILQSELSFHLNQNLTTAESATDAYVWYDIKFGESFVEYWSYTGKANNAGKLQLTSGTLHSFTTGDSIYIQMSSPAETGVYDILSTTPTSITIDLAYSGSYSATGTVRFADSRSTIFTNQASELQYVAFNGAENYQLLNDWDIADWNCLVSASPAAKFLTNCPQNYNVRTENNIYLNFYSNDMTEAVAVYIRRTGDPGSDILAYTITMTSNFMQQINVGPQNLINETGDPTLFDVYKNYSIYVANSYNDPISEIKYFNISDECSRYDNFELYFMDRLGSILPANFNLQNYRKENNVSSQYTKTLGNLSGSKWTYQSTDKGITVLNTTLTETLTLNSNWVDEKTIKYLKELYSSPNVYIKEYGKLWPVLVTNTDYPIQTKLNRKMLRNTIDIEYAVKSSIQRGS